MYAVLCVNQGESRRLSPFFYSSEKEGIVKQRGLILVVAVAAVIAVAVLMMRGQGQQQPMEAGVQGKAPVAAKAPAQGKHLRFVTVYPANTTDPHRVQASFIMNSGAVETLVGLDPERLVFIPCLAESWESEDGQHWTFVLREGVRFHTGKPMTAQAVQASLERAIAVNPGVKAALRIKAMRAEGQKLHIETDGPFPSLISGLIHFNAVIIDVEAPENAVSTGTGAFRFTRFDPTTGAELERNPDYWGEPAKLDRVSMSANQDSNARILTLQAGEVDIIYRPALESLATLRQTPGLVVESKPGTRVYHLLYNFVGANKELWANESFRKGIDALVDRQGIVDTVMGKEAEVAYNPFPGDFPFSPEPRERSFGREAALEHFRAAGLTVLNGQVSRDGKPVRLRIATYIARPELPQIAQVVQDAARQVGIDMEIHVAENIDEFLPTGKWDLATYSMLTISRGDGAFFLNASFLPKGAQNHGQIDNPELVAILEEFNRTVDQTRRNELAKQAATFIEEHAYNCYITVPAETAAYRKGVQGWITPPNEFEFQMMTNALDLSTH